LNNFIKKFFLLFTNPIRFFRSGWRIIDYLIFDHIFFFLALAIFHFSPRHLYLIYNGKHIVSNKQRWKFDGNIENDFILNKTPKKIFEEINIVCKGDSIHKYISKINLDLPTFQVNVYDKLPLETEYLGLTFTWTQAEKSVVADKLFEKGLSPILVCRSGYVSRDNLKNVSWTKKSGIYSKPGTKIDTKKKDMLNELSDYGVTHIRCYSGFDITIGGVLQAAMMLSPLSEKINIYGWDHYLEKNASDYGYYEGLFHALRAMPKKYRLLYGTRYKVSLSGSLINWFYISKMLGLPKYKIFGRVSSINQQKKILKKIDQVFLSRS